MKEKEKILTNIKAVLSKEPKLIEIKKAKTTTRPPRPPIRFAKGPLIVFVGDTHGDWEASQKVIKEYLKPKNKIVFLGDYVDRGPQSKENLDYLLQQKEKFPEQIYLLRGNHEGHHILSFFPADFWKSLSKEEYKKYCEIAEKLPLVAITDDIIALHGVLPNVKDLSEINQINPRDEQYEKWIQICWGDFIDQSGKFLGFNPMTSRPQFGRDWFFELMKRFNKKVLIRSHQPYAPKFMFDNRCLTIFTSSAYARERTIAIADLSKEIKTAKDLEIKRI